MTTGLPELLRRRLRAQADLITTLTSHPVLIGTGREQALIDLFRQFLPRRLEILQGTVAIVDDNQRPARSALQLDMIVADTMDFPTLLRSGNIAVVLSHAVRGVVEAKSDLRRGANFISALVQIARARWLLKPTDPLFTGLFSFGAPMRSDTLRDWLTDVIALRELLVTKAGTPWIRDVRDALLQDAAIGIRDEAALLQVLRSDNLPDIITSDQGAVALKVTRPDGTRVYTFLGGTNKIPSVMVLIDEFVRHLAAAATPTVHGAMMELCAHFLVDALPAPDLEVLELPASASYSSVAR